MYTTYEYATCIVYVILWGANFVTLVVKLAIIPQNYYSHCRACVCTHKVRAWNYVAPVVASKHNLKQDSQLLSESSILKIF